MSGIEISGDADADEAAAIAAVVASVLAEEDRELAAPPPRPRQSDWVRAWRPRNLSASERTPPPAPGGRQSTSEDDEE
jgi:hypothetical protein